MLTFTPKGSRNEKLSIMLIGSSDYCKQMWDAIEEKNSKLHKAEISNVKTENIDTILKSPVTDVHVDFITFLLDVSKRNCVEQVERNLAQIDPVYMCGRIVLINCTNQLTPFEMGVPYDDLFLLCQKYNLIYIQDNIKDQEGRKSLAERILNLTVSACGLNTGIPVPVQFPSDLFPLC